MLGKIKLNRHLAKADYKSRMDELEPRLGALQRKARALHIPVLVVFEGMEAAGKGTVINRLSLSMDARGFKVCPIHPPTEEEKLRPFLWRFWNQTPARGRIRIFDESWYQRVLADRIEGQVRKSEWHRAYDEINAFERQLADDGTLVLKFFMQISKKEQKKRFKKLAKNKATAWKVTRTEWRRNKNYDKFISAADEMFAETDTDYAPWTIVEAHDRRFAVVKVLENLITGLEKMIARVEGKIEAPSPSSRVSPELQCSVLDKIAVDKSLNREAYEKKLKALQKEMWELEHRAYMERRPVILAYEGWDAAGKGGNIRRVVQAMDPRGYEVIPIAAPTAEEKNHHYLWRFWRQVPKAGHFTIFDRTWYGRVLVERIEGFCSETEWKRAYHEINEMEKQWSDFGLVLFKFWLQIDSDEQLRRFEARQDNPEKKWKITEEDWRNREKWPQYKAAVDEMLFRTSTPEAPWTVVEANNKLYARIKVLETLVTRLNAEFG